MRRVAAPLRPQSWSRPVVFAALALGVAGCSAESQRFDGNPFSSRSGSDVTGSVARKPSSPVQSQPLPPPPVAGAPQTRPAVSATSGGGRGMASYQAPLPQSEVTGSVPANSPPVIAAPATRPQPVAAARPSYSWEGGTAVTVAPGENAHTLARKHGVPAEEIARANNLPDAAAIKVGQRLVIPRAAAPVVTGSVSPRPSQPAQAGAQVVHTVQPGETMMKLTRQYSVSLTAIAQANGIPAHSQLKVGDRIVIPGARSPQQAPARPVAAAPAAQPARTAARAVPASPFPPMTQAQAPRPAPAPQIASAPATTTARVVTPAAQDPVPQQKVETTAAAAAGFRWPVRGRVISGFGPRPSGGQNDGINVAVPEGTPIRAAEDGVVAYAGNELKTYGNLVLVRHPNGYVTAYAHASEILVKRDEPIKRGQVIAKAGQTGAVATPQVHFEIRKGSAPVDPLPYLDKGGNT